MGLFFTVIMLALACLFTLFSGAAAEGAACGLKLFADNVLPSLFPFMVCGYYLAGTVRARTGGGKLRAMGYALLCAVCGTPSAALICKDLKSIGKSRASMLCAALNQTGPLFIIGVLCENLLAARRLWLMFAAAHYIPSLIAAALIMPRSLHASEEYDYLPRPAPSPLVRFVSALSDATGAILRVGGTVVFFRVLHSVLSECGILRLLPEGAGAMVSGLLELTNGLELTASGFGSGRLACALCGFLLSFGGLCIFMQSKLFFRELSPLPYFAVKLALGSVSALVCWFAYPYAGGADAALAGLDEALLLERSGTLASIGLCVLLSIAGSLLYARLAVRRNCPL